MKKQLYIFFSLFLLLSFSWQCAARSVIYLNFKYHQKELAATVCENKDKPESCCAAKCYLDKEIKKEDKRQSDLPSAVKDKVEKSEIRTSLLTFVFSSGSITQEPFFEYSRRGLPLFFASVFRPPGI